MPLIDEPASPVAYCMLVTDDAYVLAALVACRAVRNTGTPHRLAVLVTPDTMSAASLSQLGTAFDDVIPVSPLSGIAVANLAQINRPDLHATLTKLHLWSLTQYARVLYLDADTLVLRSVDHLFTTVPAEEPFAAAPELGYPDCFNAGVMLLRPDVRTYEALRAFAEVHPSFDGGDQGLLNVFFGDGTRGHPGRLAGSAKTKTGRRASNDSSYYSDESSAEDADADVQVDSDARGPAQDKPARGMNWYRLSFTFNIEMHRVYRLYISAVQRYADEHRILHFIGKDKPWHFPDGVVEAQSDDSVYARFYADMVARWWDVRRSLDVA